MIISADKISALILPKKVMPCFQLKNRNFRLTLVNFDDKTSSDRTMNSFNKHTFLKSKKCIFAPPKPSFFGY